MSEHTKAGEQRVCGAKLTIDNRGFHCTENVGHSGDHIMRKGSYIVNRWADAASRLPKAESRDLYAEVPCGVTWGTGHVHFGEHCCPQLLSEHGSAHTCNQCDAELPLDAAIAPLHLPPKSEAISESPASSVKEPVPQTFRKKPVVIEAVQWDGKASTANAFLGDKWWWSGLPGAGAIIIPTLEGKHICSPGDWIIKGVKGEFYPCKPDIFAATYELVEEPAPQTFEEWWNSDKQWEVARSLEGEDDCDECCRAYAFAAWNAAKASSPAMKKDWSQLGLKALNYLNDCLLDDVPPSIEKLRGILDVPASSPAVAGGESDPNTQHQEYRIGLDQVTDARNSLVAMEIPYPACSKMRDRIVMVFDILTQVLLEHFPLIAESSQPPIKDVRGKE